MRTARKIGIVVQVRLGSSRLPRKALIEVEGKPLLLRLCDRMRLCRRAEDLIVAMSDQPQDRELEDACRLWGVPVCCGPEKDLTTRLLGAARMRGLTALVRVTGDNPLTDPQGIDELIGALVESAKCGEDGAAIAHNAHRKGYPYGTGAEVVQRSLLEKCDRELTVPDDREYVLLFARRHPERFRCIKLDAPARLQRSQYFLTVDYAEDLALQKAIYRNFGGRDDMRLEEIIAFLDANPKIAKLNSHLHKQFDE